MCYTAVCLSNVGWKGVFRRDREGNELSVTMKKGIQNKVNLFIRKNTNVFLSNMVWVGLFFAMWAILSIEMEWIPKIPCGLSETAANGWNRAFLALAYSYIAGAVIYGMTVKYPYYRNKQRLTPIIKVKVENIGVQFSYMNLEFRESNNPRVTDIEAVMALFNNKRWREKCSMPEHLMCKDVTDAFVSDYMELVRMVGLLINDYKDYLDSRQLLYLEAIRGSRLNQFFATYIGSGKHFNFTDSFYEHILLPEYKKLLIVYQGLALTCGIDISKK